MLPPGGSSEAERWVAAGRMACTEDLIVRLLAIDAVDRIITVVADERDQEFLAALGVDSRLNSEDSFDFGISIADLIASEGIQQLAYFGGASAPLLEASMIEEMVLKVRSSADPFAIVNNLHSTDWMLTNQADVILSHSQRFPSDNPLGWVLSREAGVLVEATEPCAATRLDVDTPTDLFLTVGHRSLGPALAEFLVDIPSEIKAKLSSIRSIMNTPASTLALIGRASAHVWQQLVANTQIWVRLFVEERGMVASHRLARGEVQTLIGQMVDTLGPGEFVERLGEMADAALWDTRVWMGTLPEWPSDADRFAADLGWVDAIQDPDLRKLSEAIETSRIPILGGGYGVVGGGLYALLETMTE
jgi:hypothetical protein